MASSKAVAVTLLLTCKKVPTEKAEPPQPAADHSEMRQTATPSARGQWTRIPLRPTDSQYLLLHRGHHRVSTSPHLRWRHTLPSSVLKPGKRRSRIRTGYTIRRRRHRRVDHQRLRNVQRLRERLRYSRTERRSLRNQPTQRGPSTRPLQKSQQMVM